jgi:hypothetical protein
MRALVCWRSQHAANRDELLSVIVTINDEEAEKFADLKQQYDTEMEECRSKNVEAVNALAASLDNVIEVGAHVPVCTCLCVCACVCACACACVHVAVCTFGLRIWSVLTLCWFGVRCVPWPCGSHFLAEPASTIRECPLGLPTAHRRSDAGLQAAV